MSKTELLTEAQKLWNAIDSGKIRGKQAVKKARHRIHYLKAKAKSLGQKKSTKRAKVVSKDQGILPNFLAQMDTVKIEELVVQRLFEKIQKNVNEKLKTLIEKVG